MQEILKGRECLLRVNIASVGAVQNAVKIDTHLISPSGVSTCISNGYDELAKTVEMIISGDLLNELGVYSIDMRLVFASGAIIVPTFAFADVVASVDDCEAISIVDITIQPGEVEPGTPTPTINVVGREEFEVLSAEVRIAIDEAEKATEDAIESSKGATEATSSAVLATANADKATEDAKKATENANIATQSANKATENANNAGAEAMRIATQSAQEATTAKENAENATEQAKAATALANSAAQRANEEVENLRDKANTNGNYPSMTVGKAENLVGRGEATPEEFSFRQSADNVSIEDGSAKITKIKGNSVVYNQLVDYNKQPYSHNGVTSTFSLYKIALSGVATSSTIQCLSVDSLIRGNKYMIFAECSANPKNIQFAISPFNVGGAVLIRLSVTQKSGSTIFTHSQDRKNSWVGIRDFGGNGTDLSGIEYRLWVIDLTREFGVGKEPDTIAEFYARMPIGVDMFAYNAGEIISMNVDSIKSVGEAEEQVVIINIINAKLLMKTLSSLFPVAYIHMERPKKVSYRYLCNIWSATSTPVKFFVVEEIFALCNQHIFVK